MCISARQNLLEVPLADRVGPGPHVLPDLAAVHEGEAHLGKARIGSGVRRYGELLVRRCARVNLPRRIRSWPLVINPSPLSRSAPDRTLSLPHVLS